MGDRFSITDWDKIGINERMTVQKFKIIPQTIPISIRVS